MIRTAFSVAVAALVLLVASATEAQNVTSKFSNGCQSQFDGCTWSDESDQMRSLRDDGQFGTAYKQGAYDPPRTTVTQNGDGDFTFGTTMNDPVIVDERSANNMIEAGPGATVELKGVTQVAKGSNAEADFAIGEDVHDGDIVNFNQKENRR